MREMRLWHIGVVATTVVLSGIVFAAQGITPRSVLGFAVMAVFLAGWFSFGWRFSRDPRAAVVLLAMCLVLAPLAVWASPTYLTMQTILYPLIWSAIHSLRIAIVVNSIFAALLGIGFYFALGGGTFALWQALGIQAFSLAFSISLGLWITAIERRGAEKQALLDELQAAQLQLATLSRDAGVTSERERLAREIHDTIAQDLTGLVLIAQRASRELAAGDTAAATEQLAVLEDGARTALAETRALVASSAPPALDGNGIAAALERLGERFERETSMLVEVTTDVEVAIDRDLEVVLLRCAQEGLANVRKHSGASRASIRLVLTASERSLRIADNGAGFDLAAARDGYGLSGMRERLTLVGGTLDVQSGEDGTTLLITLPREGTA